MYNNQLSIDQCETLAYVDRLGQPQPGNYTSVPRGLLWQLNNSYISPYEPATLRKVKCYFNLTYFFFLVYTVQNINSCFVFIFWQHKTSYATDRSLCILP